jgi:hypothetical protein
MSWVFTGLMKRARDFEREQARRLNEAYARWHEKHRELPRAVGDREQERRLLGTGSGSATTIARNRAPNFGEHLTEDWS